MGDGSIKGDCKMVISKRNRTGERNRKMRGCVERA